MENSIFNSEFPLSSDLEFLYNDTNIAFLRGQENIQIIKDKKTKQRKRAQAAAAKK